MGGGTAGHVGWSHARSVPGYFSPMSLGKGVEGVPGAHEGTNSARGCQQWGAKR
jgi:hypothetical protein